jgi:hypothetical protein
MRKGKPVQRSCASEVKPASQGNQIAQDAAEAKEVQDGGGCGQGRQTAGWRDGLGDNADVGCMDERV